MHLGKRTNMKFHRIIITILVAVVFDSCATTMQEPCESEIFAVKGSCFGCDEFIKVQFFDKDTKKSLSSRYFSILLVSDDEKIVSTIFGKSDENGWVYIKNIPAKKYLIFFYDDEESFRKDIITENKN